jgi:hypothetical protein
MVVLRKFSRVFVVITLLFCCDSSATSQADCAYGYRIYIRDGSGKSITNAKVEVFGLSEGDKLPAAFQNAFINRVYFVGFVMYGCSYPGHFLLRVSAKGFQSYEQPITFTEGLVACELTLQPKGSTMNVNFEILATLHGRLVDQEGRPFGGGQIDATKGRGRVYQDYSSEYGYYNLDLPKGVNTIRFTGTDIAPIVFENYRIEGKDPNLDVSVCRKCKPSE